MCCPRSWWSRPTTPPNRLTGAAAIARRAPISLCLPIYLWQDTTLAQPLSFLWAIPGSSPFSGGYLLCVCASVCVHQRMFQANIAHAQSGASLSFEDCLTLLASPELCNKHWTVRNLDRMWQSCLMAMRLQCCSCGRIYLVAVCIVDPGGSLAISGGGQAVIRRVRGTSPVELASAAAAMATAVAPSALEPAKCNALPAFLQVPHSF